MRQSHGSRVLAGAALAALLLAGCAGVGSPASSRTPTPGAGGGSGGDAFDLDPSSKKCDPARATEYGVKPTGLPEHWPADVPVIPGPCFAAFEQADGSGGYALELSIALTGADVDFDNYPPWQTANQWLVEAGMEPVFADTDTAGGRESLYREGLVTASTGDEFYHYELRIVATETDDGYVVIQYLLNLLNV